MDSFPNIFGARKFAIESAYNTYGQEEEHNGRGDAYRHLVFQALLTKKYGPTLAELIGKYHESPMPTVLGGAGFIQPTSEKEMDLYNNTLGIEIGKKANTQQEILDLARQYIEQQKAKYIPLDELEYQSRLKELMNESPEYR
jgi:hypothetical protein